MGAVFVCILLFKIDVSNSPASENSSPATAASMSRPPITTISFASQRDQLACLSPADLKRAVKHDQARLRGKVQVLAGAPPQRDNRNQLLVSRATAGAVHHPAAYSECRLLRREVPPQIFPTDRNTFPLLEAYSNGSNPSLTVPVQQSFTYLGLVFDPTAVHAVLRCLLGLPSSHTLVSRRIQPEKRWSTSIPRFGADHHRVCLRISHPSHIGKLLLLLHTLTTSCSAQRLHWITVVSSVLSSAEGADVGIRMITSQRANCDCFTRPATELWHSRDFAVQPLVAFPGRCKSPPVSWHMSICIARTTPEGVMETHQDAALAALGYRPVDGTVEMRRRLQSAVDRANFARAALASEVTAQNNRLSDLLVAMELTQRKSAEIFQGLLETHERYNVIQRDLRLTERALTQLQQLVEDTDNREA
ncbi:hypothetical protein NM688_g4163 [Phlebia brevispora]|uniref:Uncharacterized protein n=1 Tax=Phlebia brevispora TaxID=194682 RepID=A0ACC1T3P8_9APHY|nr:hypothetical protein NM688_g4163 [Phlebia brevispora]